LRTLIERSRANPTGTDCSYLNFEPVDRTRLGYMDPNYSSWGANAVQHNATGEWHMFVTEIACKDGANANGTPAQSRCGLDGWKTHSQVAHAVAPHPAGPYTRKGLVHAPEHHNPTVQASFLITPFFVFFLLLCVYTPRAHPAHVCVHP
jgi:hypothetical protein